MHFSKLFDDVFATVELFILLKAGPHAKFRSEDLG